MTVTPEETTEALELVSRLINSKLKHYGEAHRKFVEGDLEGARDELKEILVILDEERDYNKKALHTLLIVSIAVVRSLLQKR